MAFRPFGSGAILDAVAGVAALAASPIESDDVLDSPAETDRALDDRP